MSKFELRPMKSAGRFGDKAKSLGFDPSKVRPLSECRRPEHPVKIEIRKGLIVYAAKGADVKAIRKKYEGK